MIHQYIVNTSTNTDGKFAAICRTAIVLAKNARGAVDRAEELLRLQPGEYVNGVIMTAATPDT